MMVRMTSKKGHRTSFYGLCLEDDGLDGTKNPIFLQARVNSKFCGFKNGDEEER